MLFQEDDESTNVSVSFTFGYCGKLPFPLTIDSFLVVYWLVFGLFVNAFTEDYNSFEMVEFYANGLFLYGLMV